MRTRRVFVRDGALAMVAFGGAPSLLIPAAEATSTAAGNPVLVTVFLRGGMDGLMAVPPIDDPELERSRPRIAMSASRHTAKDERVIDLGCGFGLHPAFGALEPLWRSQRLAIVHGVGSPHPTRSHFDAQDYMESGTPGLRGTRSGWLNRTAEGLADPASPLRAVTIAESLPRSLQGDFPAVAIPELSSFVISSGSVQRRVSRLYAAAEDERFRTAGHKAVDALRLVAQARESIGRSRVSYPRSPLGRQLEQVAMLIRADVGLEIASCESGDWDTHIRQGTGAGPFARAGRDLADSIAAFWSDLGAHADRVLVLTMTEFGRTVAENGSAGTDHGHGSCLFALGRTIDGGKVHGKFPGLEPDRLFEGRDLAVTTDFRSVFSEVSSTHLGAENPDLFPGWRGTRTPLLKTGPG
jgi:uncharacterized protein (DUF1501 family)